MRGPGAGGRSPCIARPTGHIAGFLARAASAFTVGNQPELVMFDGSAPGSVDGIDQLNILLSPKTPSGAQPIVITVGGISSPSISTLNIE